MKPFKLPEGLKLGAATASLQIEGGDRNNSWYRWCEQGHIKDSTHCKVADDHWNRVEEDVTLMENLHLDIYRMSLEWARLEPSEGKFSQEALSHYREELELLREKGIHPLVTLHHFSNPLWLEDSGAWLSSEVVEHFARYVQFVVENLGDLVEDWVTINEPNVYLFHGYIEGIWPPGVKGSPFQYLKGARNMILAHQRAYELIHRIQGEKNRGKCRVGAAHHLRVFEPVERSLLSKITTKFYFQRLFEDLFLEGMTTGKLIFPLLGQGSSRPCSDFMGINYYTRDQVKGMNLSVMEGSPTNNLGWEIYPEGLFEICQRQSKKYGLPIVIAENGTCDDLDAFRAQYIYDHLYQVSRLIKSGVKVDAYCHWTLMDNFEWVEGLQARFGLVEVDFETQKRTIRRSGEFYSEICEKKKVTDEMIEKYISS